MKNNLKENNRLVQWDMLKGIAIFLVVWGHLNQIDYIMNIIAVVHMPLFFVASGYFAVYTFSRNSIANVLKKKIKTLLVPFVVWSMIALSMNCLKALVRNEFDREFLLNKIEVVFLKPMSVWFLWALFVVFLIFTIAKKMEQYIGKISFLVVGSVWCTIVIIFKIDILSFNKVAVNYWWFIMGYYLHGIDFKNLMHNKYIKLSIMYIPMYIVVFSIITTEEFYMYYSCLFSEDISLFRGCFVSFISCIYAIMGMLFVWRWIIPFLEKSILKKMFIKFGRYSLDIYTIHMMFVGYIVFIPDIVSNNYIFLNYIYYPIYAFFICMLICVLTDRILHKLNIYKIFMLGKF